MKSCLCAGVFSVLVAGASVAEAQMKTASVYDHAVEAEDPQPQPEAMKRELIGQGCVRWQGEERSAKEPEALQKIDCAYRYAPIVSGKDGGIEIAEIKTPDGETHYVLVPPTGEGEPENVPVRLK